jgi:hypothetical protein
MEFTDENPFSRNHRGYIDPHPRHLRDRANRRARRAHKQRPPRQAQAATNPLSHGRWSRKAESLTMLNPSPTAQAGLSWWEVPTIISMMEEGQAMKA